LPFTSISTSQEWVVMTQVTMLNFINFSQLLSKQYYLNRQCWWLRLEVMVMHFARYTLT
jgi:hypothetical protein